MRERKKNNHQQPIVIVWQHIFKPNAREMIIHVNDYSMRDRRCLCTAQLDMAMLFAVWSVKWEIQNGSSTSMWNIYIYVNMFYVVCVCAYILMYTSGNKIGMETAEKHELNIESTYIPKNYCLHTWSFYSVPMFQNFVFFLSIRFFHVIIVWFSPCPISLYGCDVATARWFPLLSAVNTAYDFTMCSNDDCNRQSLYTTEYVLLPVPYICDHWSCVIFIWISVWQS